MARMSLMSTDARMVECVLFIENEALELERICQMTGLDEKAAKRALKELDGVFRDSGHGIRLKENSDGSYEFAPCEDLYDMLRSTYGRKVDRRLTRAALETLSIIAYKQPITRREIDNIRGVASDNIVRLLREREYIKVVGRKDVQGHPCLYGTSRKFLFEFGLRSISELPRLSSIDQMRFEDDEDSLFPDSPVQEDEENPGDEDE